MHDKLMNDKEGISCCVPIFRYGRMRFQTLIKLFNGAKICRHR